MVRQQKSVVRVIFIPYTLQSYCREKTFGGHRNEHDTPVFLLTTTTKTVLFSKIHQRKVTKCIGHA